MPQVEIFKKEPKVYRFVATNKFGEKIGYAYVTLSHKDIANIAYLESYIPGTGSVLMQSIIDWAHDNSINCISGTINSVTLERIVGLCEKFDFEISKSGQITKQLLPVLDRVGER